MTVLDPEIHSQLDPEIHSQIIRDIDRIASGAGIPVYGRNHLRGLDRC